MQTQHRVRERGAVFPVGWAAISAHPMHAYQKGIGRSRAIALCNCGWWLGRTAREIAKFQLFTVELCLPFEIFHRAVEEALGRPVWVHEFGLNLDGLIQEFLGERDAPTLDEILDLLPSDKRYAVFVEDAPF